MAYPSERLYPCERLPFGEHLPFLRVTVFLAVPAPRRTWAATAKRRDSRQLTLDL